MPFSSGGFAARLMDTLAKVAPAGAYSTFLAFTLISSPPTAGAEDGSDKELPEVSEPVVSPVDSVSPASEEGLSEEGLEDGAEGSDEGVPFCSKSAA